MMVAVVVGGVAWSKICVWYCDCTAAAAQLMTMGPVFVSTYSEGGLPCLPVFAGNLRQRRSAPLGAWEKRGWGKSASDCGDMAFAKMGHCLGFSGTDAALFYSFLRYSQDCYLH